MYIGEEGLDQAAARWVIQVMASGRSVKAAGSGTHLSKGALLLNLADVMKRLQWRPAKDCFQVLRRSISERSVIDEPSVVMPSIRNVLQDTSRCVLRGGGSPEREIRTGLVESAIPALESSCFAEQEGSHSHSADEYFASALDRAA